MESGKLEVNESLETSEKAKKAIVDILTQYYLEDLIFTTNDSGIPVLKDKNEQVLIDCSLLLEKSEKITFYKPQIHETYKLGKYFRTPNNQKGYGTIYYLLSAIKFSEEQKCLQSSPKTSDSARKTWERFEKNHLAKKIEDRGHEVFLFVSLSNLDLEVLHSRAKEKAGEAKKFLKRKKTTSKKIQERLRRSYEE